MNVMFTALLCGLCLSTGIVLTFGLATGRIVWRARRSSSDGRLRVWVRRVWRGPYRDPAGRRTHQQRLLAGVAAGIVLWAVSGMPAFGLAAMLTVPGLPWLLGAGKLEEAAIARLHAIESWTRRLKDVVHKGLGLQQAIIASLSTTPPEIRAEVRDLVARLQSGADIQVALLKFGADLDDEYADEMIAALMTQVSMRGARLGHRLVDVADDIAEDVNDRTETQSKRAEGQYTLKVLTAMSVALFAGGLFAPSYVQPFASGTGQMLLLAGIGAMIGLLLTARKLNMPPVPERFLRLPGQPAPDQRQDLADLRQELEAAA